MNFNTKSIKQTSNWDKEHTETYKKAYKDRKTKGANEMINELRWSELTMINVTLDHKTSLKLLGYICINSQKYIL